MKRPHFDVNRGGASFVCTGILFAISRLVRLMGRVFPHLSVTAPILVSKEEIISNL